MAAFAVDCRGVHFTYWGASTPALRGIDVQIEPGEFVVLAGPAGAGKSTFLLLLNGLIPHLVPGRLDGQVCVCGQETRTARISELATRVGIVFEDPDTQIVSLTVEDDVAFGPSNLALPAAEIRRRVNEALEQCRLSGFQGRNPFTLSGGEKQSLAIAGVLAMRPQILALDEPTSMLDPLGRAQVVSILKNLVRETGTTILMAEQNPEITLDLADRVLVFDHGTIVQSGSPGRILRDTKVMLAAGVKLPPMVDLFHALHARGHFTDQAPLSVEEAAKILHPRVQGKPTPVSPASPCIPASDAEPLVQLRDVQHRYEGSVDALRGVNLTVQPGEMTAIVGQNGSGKTTIAYHMVGLRNPTNRNAQVRVAGLDVPRTPLRRLLAHINYVFQNPDDQLCEESVALEVGYGPSNLRLPERDRTARVERALKLFGLQEYRDQPPKTLNRGLRTKTALAAIVAMDPAVLIIDEPTTGLDRRESLAIFEILEQLRDEGKTILFISHEMDLVAQFARRIVVMHQGRVLTAGPPEQVFAEEQVLQQASLLPPETHRLCRQLDWPLWPGLRTTADLADALTRVLED